MSYHLIFELIFFWVHVLINLIHSTKHFWGILFCFLDYVFFKSGGFIILSHAMFLSFKGWLVLFAFIWECCLSIFGYLPPPPPTPSCSYLNSSIQTFALFWSRVDYFSLAPFSGTLITFSPWAIVWELGTEYHPLYCRLMEGVKKGRGKLRGSSVTSVWCRIPGHCSLLWDL